MTQKNFHAPVGINCTNTTQFSINSTAISVGANLQVNATHFQVGNATVNCVINSTAMAFNGLSSNPGVVKLANGVVSAAATLSIVLTSYTSYRVLGFELSNFIPATNNVNLWIRTSTNGGSSYAAGASDYAYAGIEVRPDGIDTVEAGSIEQMNIGNQGTSNVASVGGFSAMVYLCDQAATRQINLLIEGVYATSNQSGITTTMSGARRLSAADVDAIRFMFASGNITSGNWAIYGYK